MALTARHPIPLSLRGAKRRGNPQTRRHVANDNRYWAGVTTVVLPAGGDGLLLLNDRHPASANGIKRTINAIRMGASFSYTSHDIGPTGDSHPSIMLA